MTSVLTVLIALRDLLIAMALAWVGVSVKTAGDCAVTAQNQDCVERTAEG